MQSSHGQGCQLLHVIHPAFPLPTTVSSNLQGALKDGYGEAVVAYDMTKQHKFQSLDGCLQRLLWANKEVDLAPLPVVGLVHKVEDAEKSPQTLSLKMSLDHFFRVTNWASRVHVSQPQKSEKITRLKYNMNLLAKLVPVALLHFV